MIALTLASKKKWSRLYQKDCHDNFLPHYYLNIDKNANAWCTWYDEQIVKERMTL